MRITLVAGARPNFMKIAPIIWAIEEYNKLNKTPLNYRLIHTGQHYDKKMSGDFFGELSIPDPHRNLEAGSGSAAEQTATIMIGFEKELLSNPTDLVIVVGDVTSTMACAIVAQKLHTKVAHIEGGIRSGDWTMPEEINRLVTDSISNYFFTTSVHANKNLQASGVEEERIFFVGNTMIDSLVKQMPKFKQPDFWDGLKLSKGNYLIMTLHRPSNVDDKGQLLKLIESIEENTNGLPVIFPVHPRTRKNMDSFAIKTNHIKLVEPLSYLEFNYLVQHSKGVITDSGGITEETTVMGIPCLTLRNSTERPETCIIGTNELIGTDPENLKVYLKKLFSGAWKTGAIPELWDGATAKRIIDIITNKLIGNKAAN